MIVVETINEVQPRELEEITWSEVEIAVKSKKNGKTAGSDKIIMVMNNSWLSRVAVYEEIVYMCVTK